MKKILNETPTILISSQLTCKQITYMEKTHKAKYVCCYESQANRLRSLFRLSKAKSKNDKKNYIIVEKYKNQYDIKSEYNVIKECQELDTIRFTGYVVDNGENIIYASHRHDIVQSEDGLVCIDGGGHGLPDYNGESVSLVIRNGSVVVEGSEQPKSSKHYVVYTDGSCLGNPGNGGYAWVVTGRNIKTKLYGGYSKEETTNNRMELQAIISAINPKKYENGSTIHVHSDSQYCVNGINKWMNGWKLKNWRDVKNVDLWKTMYNLTTSLKNLNITLKVNYVRGHNGNKYNEMCDEEAKRQANIAKSK